MSSNAGRMNKLTKSLHNVINTTGTAATLASDLVVQGLERAETVVFILVGTNTSGTTPTLNATIEVSTDGGTTYFAIGRFAEITTSATRRYIMNTSSIGNIAIEAAVADTGGALVANFPLTRNIRITSTLGGTNPIYDIDLHIVFNYYG